MTNTTTITAMEETNTKFITLNCHGFKSNSTYITKISQSYDIIYLSELWITEAEKHLLHNYNHNFHVLFQPAIQGISGRPFGGTALLIKKTLPKPDLILKNDFSTCVKLNLKRHNLLIMGVYLQSTSKDPNCKETYFSQLATISGIIKQFINSTEPIILGDFQSCPTTHQTERVSNQNTLTETLNNFITDHQLTPIDITNGSGPTFTYHHISLQNKSYIDHILTSNNVTNEILDVRVLPHHYLNTSDHLPVVCEMITEPSDHHHQYHTNESHHIPNYMWNNDTFVKNYSSLVSQHLAISSDFQNIDEELSHLHETLKKCAIQTYNDLKKTDFRFIDTKHWWNSDLSKKRKVLQQMFNIWRDNHFPKDPNDVSFNRYRFARKDFRLFVKKCKNQSTTNHYINIEKVKKTKPRSYWKEIRLAKSDDSKLYTINNKSNIPDITNEFNAHFDHLLNTPRTKNIDNDTSNKLLTDLLDNLENNRENDFHVTDHDVFNAIQSLNKNKTFDPLDIKAEHFIHCSNDKVLTYLSNLINKILSSPRLPPVLATSHIIPIIKSHRKPIKDPNNYRGISLIPTLTKIIEKLILQKCPQLKNHKSTQFGFTSDASTIHAELLIRDTISYYNTKHSPVYICSLDAEKAFDCCNWHLLFQKLKQKNILPDIVLRFLIKLYMNGEASTKYKNVISTPFRLAQGVRQGSILSPYLYNLYTEDIIDRIQNLQIGTYLPGSINTSIIVFADDIILLSPNLRHLQTMIDECTSFGMRNGLNFNAAKTQFLISGSSPFRNPKINLNGNHISPQCTLKHLGFNWKLDRNILSLKNHQASRISEMWATTASLTSCGIRKFHPSTVASVFRSVVVPKLLYGLELTNISKSDFENIDRQCRCAFKQLLGLSKHCSNDLNRLLLTDSVGTEIKNRKINFMQLLMKNETTSKYLISLLSSSFSDRSFSILQDILDLCLNENISIYNLLLNRKFSKLSHSPNLDDDKRKWFQEILSNWHLYDNRVKLRETLEAKIHKNPIKYD